ncbi:MAG TPA: adenylate/guanylate cyclase domain-containing protein [Candidatus Limnocylindrales bacterium]|jgi:class 3 adenylate cyclase/tetratricopeptide (TPR) repeat protein|nr:adenylate/guanylate cyclase domain-containing protein [Candidatus Limnocylindrales bacterium]
MGAITCSTCGATIPDPYRRCGSCGTPREAERAPAEIRRFVTVVNSDLKGSTALGERLDPETLREVLTLYFDEMTAVFESHGGTIEKIIGDAIVAVFGLPVRHDDDALRAVEAAAESQRVLGVLNERLAETWGVRLVVRTGIASGDVIVGEESVGQHVLTGDTMTISSAMEQHAPPLEVLVAESTLALVRDMVDVEPTADVAPRGLSLVVPAFRLVSVAPRPEAGHAGADTVETGLRLCPACGEVNPESFRHCGMCGAGLRVVAPHRESRKTVTIVFADPKPTTLDGSPPRPEALRDVMSRYFDAMRAALEGHGGTVERFIGDAVMAVFGLPVRHEDDALRAVRAAAAMQAALPALNEEFRATWGLELGNHIGVNTGEVIAGDARLGQRLVTGDAVNTAARIEGAAGARETILGELTYRLARDQIEVEPIPPLTLKGKAEPVAAFRLVSVRGPASERTSLTTPFVGRVAEMDRLETTLLEVAATRSCELLTVIGEAGVGKSRLIREFATRASAAERTQVVRGRCLPYGDGVTFWPIAEIVRNAAGIADEDSPDVALARIAEIARGAAGRSDDPTEIADRVAAAIGLSTAQFPGPELFWGIRKLLEAIASRRPLVAIIDDIHVAAPTFLELLDHLIDTVQEAPILLLTTARHELLDVRTEWAVRHETQQLVLEPLAADDADAILDQLLGGLDRTIRQRILTAAEGNPLYVEQLTSMLIETGALRRDGGGWVATTSSEELATPPTVEALVAARIDGLGVGERGVIDPASVIGLGFAVDAVVHLVPEEDAPAVPVRLQSLTTKQLVRPTLADEDFYRFGHSVIKDAAYRSLLKRTRAELHERFVAWAEPINRERGREIEFEEILGYHLEQAYRYRSELGPMDDAVQMIGRQAVDKLASAGRRAFGRGDAPAAANLLRRASGLLPPDDQTRIELLTDLAYALLEQGAFEAATGVLDEAGAAARAIGDARLGARTLVATINMNLYGSGLVAGTERAVVEVVDSLGEFARVNDIRGTALAWRLLMVLHGTVGQFDRAAEAAQRVVDLAAQVDDTRLAASGAVGYATSVLLGATPVAEALARCQDLVHEVQGDRKAEAVILGSLAQLHAMEGRFEQARSLYTQSQQLLADLGPSITGASTAFEASRVEMLAGDPSAAEGFLRRDYVQLEAVGERYFRSSIAAFLAHALWASAKFEDADTYARIAEDLSDADDVWSQVAWRTVRAKLLARDGRSDEAIALATGAVHLAAGTSNIDQHADALVDLDEVLRLTGHGDEAGPPLREALSLYEQKGDLVLADRLRSLLEVSAR